MEFKRIGVSIVERYLRNNRDGLVADSNAHIITIAGNSDGAYYEVCYVYDGDNIAYDCDLKFYNDDNIPF